MSTIRFRPSSTATQTGLVLIYDLEGFSLFFNQPDAPRYVPLFLNHVSSAIESIIFGGHAYWAPAGEQDLTALSKPIHEKFVGDGCMYVWTQDGQSDQEWAAFIVKLCNRVWNLKNEFSAVVLRASNDIPIAELPKRIRFGLAGSTVQQLTTADRPHDEYVGICLNLASRLQKYCQELGFIASARIGVSEQHITEHGYTKIVATKIRGFPRELVIVDSAELHELESAIRANLFEDFLVTNNKR